MTTTSPRIAPKPQGRAAPPLSEVAVRPLKLGLIGFGKVGRGFSTLVSERADVLARTRRVRPAVTCVLVRDLSRHTLEGAENYRITADPAVFLDASYDAVIEASGAVEGVEPILRRLLARGTPVITANKTLVAKCGAELERIATQANTTFRFEASVAAGIPVFQLLERSFQSTRFRRIAAILNGTSNFVLTRLAAQDGAPSFATALGDAVRAGLAEPDATDDVSGIDAARKLSILARVLGARQLEPADIELRGVGGVEREDCTRAALFGYRLKPVAVADLAEDPRAWVGPALVPAEHPLASVDGESNGIQLLGDTIAEIFVSGPGAGAKPTAAALLDDVLCATDTAAALHVHGPVARLQRGPLASPPAGTPCRPQSPAPGAARDAAGDPWFIAVAVDLRAITVGDVVEFLAAAGLTLVESKRLAPSKESVTLAGITTPASSQHVYALAACLRRAAGIGDVRAFRVIERGAAR